MRKKDLKDRLPKKWPDHSTAKIIWVKGVKVLMLLLPEWKKNCPKIQHSYTAIAGLAHFIWDNGYLTYYRKYDYWTCESLNWIEYNSELSANDFDTKSYDAIRRFTEHTGSMNAIEFYEQETRWRQKIRYRENKQKRIDGFMKKTTPKLPANFRAWCIRKLGKKQRINVKLFQKTDTGMISRMFWVDRYKKDGPVNVTEICRAYMKDITGRWEKYFYGETHNVSGTRQRFWDRKGDSVVNVLPAWYFIYDNLDSLDISPDIKSCIRIMDGLRDPEGVALMVKENPEYEQIVKLGLTRIAAELYSRDSTLKMAQRLKCLPKDRLRKLIELNGSEYTWELLKVFPKITDENLKIFNEIRQSDKANSIMNFYEEDHLNLNHLFTLWKNTGGIKVETINKYNDYLRMAERLGNDITDEIIYRDKKWRQRHDAYLEEINRRRAEQEKAKQDALAGKWRGIRRDYERNTKLFGWKKDGYIVMVPKSYGEINEEGRRQHHCVGAQDQYKTRMAVRESYIVFLRKAEAPNRPYYTIEVNEHRILQWYGAYDRKPDAEKVKKVLDKWMKQVKKNFAKERKTAEICATSHKTTSVAAG